MLPGYVVSTMVRALRELTGASGKPAEEAKLALYELSVTELDSAIETFDALANLARDCSAFQQMLRASSLGQLGQHLAQLADGQSS